MAINESSEPKYPAMTIQWRDSLYDVYIKNPETTMVMFVGLPNSVPFLVVKDRHDSKVVPPEKIILPKDPGEYKVVINESKDDPHNLMLKNPN